MSPLIRSQDILHVHGVFRYGKGDVLLYEREHRWFVHRLIRHLEDADGQPLLVLQGDALPSPDPPISPEAVLGRVERIERKGRVLRLDGLSGRAYGSLMRIPMIRDRLVPLACMLIPLIKRTLRRSPRTCGF